MKTLLIVSLTLLTFSTQSFAEEHSSSNHQSASHSSSNSSKRTFPSYPSRSYGQSIARHSDSFGNKVTQDHNNRIQFANGRSDSVMRNDFHVNDTVHWGRSTFANVYRPGFESRNLAFTGYLAHYNSWVLTHPPILDYWHDHFFFGGFYWGFYPLLNIDYYFFNPMVFWMFVPTYNEAYYQTWYSSEYDNYPTLHYPFLYHGLYFPTENLKQLLFGVSAMPVDRQVQFRAAITIFTKEIAQTLANQLRQRVALSNGDIVVTHYEILSYDAAIEVEGFSNYNNQAYEFKGLLDLQDPERTSVFIPQNLAIQPSADTVQPLVQINSQINKVQGELPGVPSEPEVPATPAEVTAEPK